MIFLITLFNKTQMPRGIPVATVAIGNASNAGLLAIRILAAGGLGNREVKKSPKTTYFY